MLKKIPKLLDAETTRSRYESSFARAYERLYFVPYERICSKTAACKLFYLDYDETLNGRLPPEDSSDFDDFWTELIVMT